MAIDLESDRDRSLLQRAVRFSYENNHEQREKRRQMVDIYRGESSLSQWIGPPRDDSARYGTLLNLFLQFVRAHLVALAYQAPKYSVNARTQAGRGFDKRIQVFLKRYGEILDIGRVFRQCALDSAFGNAVVKIISSIAPKGVTAPVAPRVYRIDPDLFGMDPTAAVPEEASFLFDIYLVPLNEARQHPSFDSELANSLRAWRESDAGDVNSFSRKLSDLDAFAEDYTRLIDVYLPSRGVIATWPATSDAFGDISTSRPLQEVPSNVNPYEVCQLLQLPGSLEEITRLWSLRGLHLLSNDMYTKTAGQGRRAKRNPVDKLGNESDMHNLSTAADGEEVFVDDPSSLDLYTVPGPDASIVQLAQLSAQLFSQYAGNIEVALGQSAGAPTARQTQALIGQITAQSALDRSTFETFMANVGKKLATLAFHDEVLELEVAERVPGTQFSYNAGWAPPDRLPRMAAVDDFSFEVVPGSSSFRSPQERVAQLQQASQGVLQWMAVANQGAPIELGAVMQSFGEAFDLVPELMEWWSGTKPTPVEQAANTYTSTAGPSTGSTVTYEGNSGGTDAEPGIVDPGTGGLQNGGV